MGALANALEQLRMSGGQLAGSAMAPGVASPVAAQDVFRQAFAQWQAQHGGVADPLAAAHPSPEGGGTALNAIAAARQGVLHTNTHAGSDREGQGFESYDLGDKTAHVYIIDGKRRVILVPKTPAAVPAAA